MAEGHDGRSPLNTHLTITKSKTITKTITINKQQSKIISSAFQQSKPRDEVVSAGLKASEDVGRSDGGECDRRDDGYMYQAKTYIYPGSILSVLCVFSIPMCIFIPQSMFPFLCLCLLAVRFASLCRACQSSLRFPSLSHSSSAVPALRARLSVPRAYSIIPCTVPTLSAHLSVHSVYSHCSSSVPTLSTQW
jgi:hypothetical protein